MAGVRRGGRVLSVGWGGRCAAWLVVCPGAGDLLCVWVLARLPAWLPACLLACLSVLLSACVLAPNPTRPEPRPPSAYLLNNFGMHLLTVRLRQVGPATALED